MTWKEAIKKVLEENKIGDFYLPMHYRDITNKIIDENLVDSYGKNPARTVCMTLTTSKGMFLRVDDGIYILTAPVKNAVKNQNTKKVERKQYQIRTIYPCLFRIATS